MKIENEYIYISGTSGERKDTDDIHQMVVLLHGYGADGQDLIDIGAHWGDVLPNTLFVAPNAPTLCEQNPFGYQWFSLLSYDEDRMLRGLESASKILTTYLDDLVDKYKIADGRMALMGFSQGAMLSLYQGFFQKQNLAGVLAYSGALFTPPEKPLQTPPTLLIHGDKDLVVPLSSSIQAEEQIKSFGGTINFHICQGLGHGIDPKGIQIGQEFLQKVFNHETIKK